MFFGISPHLRYDQPAATAADHGIEGDRPVRIQLPAQGGHEVGMQNDDLAASAVTEIRSALITQAYDQLPIALVVNLVNGLLLAGVLWDGVRTPVLLLWALAVLVVTALRYALLQTFRDPRRRVLRSDDSWRRNFVLGTCAAGLVWGAAGLLLFDPVSLTRQVFLAFVLGGMIAGAIPLLSPLNGAYECFAIPVVLPITGQMLLIGDRVHVIMGLMILVFGLAMLSTSTRVRRVFEDSTDLRLQLASSVEEGWALQRMLRMDELTRIGNRRLFDEQLAMEWRRSHRKHQVISVVTADIDHFKAYNDHYGHLAGDRCLARVAQSMADALQRPGDVAARIGGEEFAFVLPDTTLLGAEHVAEEIRAKVLELNLPHEASPVAGQVTVSLGVASSEQPRISAPEDLVHASDAALYEAKRRGRNQVSSAVD
jgi:diguanylate cyclase (GGDEF)-like protein